MSYILDALRRADAERERERGAVPNLHAQSRRIDDDDEPRKGLPAWAWLALGAVIAALVIGVWSMRADDRQPAASGRVAPMPPAAALPAPAEPVAASVPAAPAVLDATAPADPAPAARPPEAKRPAPPKPVAKAVVTPRPPEPVKPAPVRRADPPAASSGPVLRMNELPESLRRQLPALGVGGSVYSPDPSGRMVILNGQVLREGDTVAAGLVVEQIRQKSAVLSIKGQRFELPL